MAEQKKTAAAKKEEEAKNELQTQDTQEVTEYDYGNLDLGNVDLDDMSGLENIDLSDIRVPYAKIYSKVQDGYQMGDVVFPDGTLVKALREGEEVKNLSILKPRTVRVMFPAQYKKGQSFICRSLDGEVGADDGEYAGQPCATCEFSKFPEEGGAPPCRPQYLLLMTGERDGNLEMFHLLISGVQVPHFTKQFLSIEMMSGLREAKKKIGKGVLLAMNLTMTMDERDTTDYGKFPVPTFKMDPKQKLHSPQRIQENIEMFESYKTFEKEAVESAAAAASQERSDEEKDEGETVVEDGKNTEAF